MIRLDDYIQDFSYAFWSAEPVQPWEIIDQLETILTERLKLLGSDYFIKNNQAIHKTAIIEPGVILKGTLIISENAFIAAHAYLRGPVFLGNAAKIGPGSEIKNSLLLDHSAAAHFNYIGNSLIGHHVNFEAGSVCANHFNERNDKTIFVMHRGERINTGVIKFGALVGDHVKIGANAVLSPGTILEKNRIVGRLELINQTN